MLLTKRTAGATAFGLLAGLALAVLYFRLDPAHYPFPRCPVYWLTGLHCPGCGTQRALHALLHGHVGQAAGFNLLAAVLAPVVGLGLLEEARGYLAGTSRRLTLLYSPWLSWGIAAMAVVFCILRNLPGPLGAWLAP
ncbi:DUF2752 domain-containing protein [Microvirga sp. STR05]|uniref:DUF2752 domain-containing protein n=1 Tax=Hymenobacter duratus TaxID=2771356 RepID=A0ABR8JGP1_9BACT|nr:DUF2752 domain-containing protein [Hymenobacter duratus]MBD2713984.1 DUF2752 domain-containing protein [Hymenobacter duratus]MBR7948886.1 DUF2752 domain-containing protein [Microvirga sp. STR05]